MSSSNFLSKIIERKKGRLAELKPARTLEELRREALSARAGARRHVFREALADAGRVNIIAEFKRASPSKGEIRGGASASETARAYERGGAAAVSVLTEEDFFRGSLRDLAEVKESVRLPVLRKDFIFEGYQVFESAAAGADALLLIVAALEDATLARLLSLAEEELGLDALVEVHTAEELKRALDAGAQLVGVNNRNLHTFEVSLETSFDLAALAPRGTLLVSESGLRDASDIARLRACGFGAFLVGETLMRAERPEEALRALTSPTEGHTA
ncbi:MAG TPA: indole-3-glycerol phosphate synthase TrpC [Pyrinomonadaceae bacterium]|jgi:indole-3-glycerol phosphate synthase|nr:indole-3-glycerol phosphate synthase TrpC [Pyrinomonadaceae bacterium]